MNDEKNISGLIHHISRQLTISSNQKWVYIGYPDIRTTHISILLRVLDNENNHNIIAKQLGLSRQAISKLKHELIENGYLIINTDKSNKISEILSLTDKGKQFLKDFEKANEDLEKTFSSIIGPDNFKIFKESLLVLDKFFKEKKTKT